LENFLNKARDDRERAYLLNMGLEQVRTTVWRQLLFAEFELAIHRLIESGEALTQEVFCRLWRSLNERYYAPLLIDAENDLEWSRIPHFYSAFYVYQYATGYAAATSISQAILREGESAAVRYVDFLKKGSSAYPLDLLRIAGIDLTGPAPFEETFAAFSNRLNQLESLLL
jgi:oligoendopeptidase F